MAEVRIQIPDAVVEALQQKLGTNTKVTDMARDAFSLFNWAVGERAKGRVVTSSDTEGVALTQITMPSLDSVKQS